MTQQQQPTPGPWHVGPTPHYFTNGRDRTQPLLSIRNGDTFPVEVALVWAHNPANAALLATAPDLLAALKLALDTIDGFYAHDSDEEQELADVEEKLIAVLTRATTTEEEAP